ncbi:hypothetical protein V8V50_09430 [Ligilactobacillus salivarius]
MTFDKGSLRSFSQSELNSILSNSKVDPGLKNYLKTKEWGNLYKLEQGVSWKYINVFKDTKTGKMVDVKVTIQGLGNNYSNKYGLPPMIMVGEKYIGTDVAGIGAVRYGLEFFEHGTDKKLQFQVCLELVTLIIINQLLYLMLLAFYEVVKIKKQMVKIT